MKGKSSAQTSHVGMATKVVVVMKPQVRGSSPRVGTISQAFLRLHHGIPTPFFKEDVQQRKVILDNLYKNYLALQFKRLTI